MRLHRLELTGVGPFKDRQQIDFDELASSGLFLIEGPTGSGKTTIIDAIVYALFGVVSSGGDDVTRMRIRSHYCTDTDPTGVSCEFSVDGRRHHITRVPAKVRDPDEPDKPAKSQGVRQVLVEYAGDGSQKVVLTSRKEIEDHIVGLLRMSAEQFRQLVVLPQGQFAELLRKTPVERLASLAPLLEDAFIAKVQDDLDRKGQAARGRRQAAVVDVDQAAQQLAGRLSAWAGGTEVDFTDPDAGDDARVAAVDAILGRLAAQSTEAAAAREAQAGVTDAAREAATSTATTHVLLREVTQAQQAVEEALADLATEDADVTRASLPGRLGELQVLVGSLGTHAVWEQQAAARAQDRARLVAEAEAARAEEARLAREREALPAARAAAAASLTSARIEAAGLAGARTEEGRVATLLGKAAELSALTAQVASRQQAVDQAESAESTALQAAQSASDEWEALLARQHAGSAAALAAALAAGDACPVCGSTEHPSPAQPADDADVVTEQKVAAARESATEARATATQAAAHTSNARTAHATAVTEAASVAGALGDHDESTLAAALVGARELLASCEAAVERVAELEGQVAGLEEREHALAASVREQQSAADRLEATIAAQDASDRKRDADVSRAIGPAESATGLLAVTAARVDTLAVLSAAWVELDTTAARVPAEHRTLSLDEAAERAEQARHAHEEAESVLAGLAQRATSLTGAHDEAVPLAQAFTAALVERTSVDAQTAPAIDLANLVTANNHRRLQLRSYALQRRFESVLLAASVHLERMSAGKFRFELSEDTARAGQSGLGITVFDSWTGQPQDPKSLSGGETFYASLALALGLADVVRGEAGGSALETLFVDEGFGSLDQDTLYQVLDQLDQLRAGRRAVGVVSHVTEMKESIPDRIEVRRQPDSTSIVVRAGRA